MLKKVFFLWVMLTALSHHAYGAHVWSDYKSVVEVQVVGSNNGFIIYFDSEVNPVCTTEGTNSIYVYPNQNGVSADSVKTLLSVTLTALASGMKVKALYDDASATCWARYLKIKK